MITYQSKFTAHWSWFLYLTLILVRIIVGPLLPGYVHPDEFFQGGQELWFGCPPTIPWEFEPNNALRSIVPPTLMSWLPLKIYSILSFRGHLGDFSGWEVWIVPRVACAIMSVCVVDGSVWALSSYAQLSSLLVEGVPTSVLLLASAWPSMVLLNRPFSNSMETYVLALLFTTVFMSCRKSSSGSSSISLVPCCIAAGLCALGLFTRFTFAFFAFPVVLVLLFRLLNQDGFSTSLVVKLFSALSTFVMISIGIVYLDTQFYSSRLVESLSKSESDSPVLTPLNALLYNSKVSNLKDHGLHPHWTHAVVNMFLLYGPIAILGYLSFLGSRFMYLGGKEMAEYRSVKEVSKWTVICGLGFLSLAPHQEPRFLLPLLVPMVLLGDNQKANSRMFCLVWVLFNFVMVMLFGILHQAGVVSSLLAVGSSLSDRQPSSIIYFHTYMPPTFLTRPDGTRGLQDLKDQEMTCSSKYGNACRHVGVVDLNGASLSQLRETLEEELQCFDETEKPNYRSVLLAAPSMEDENNLRLTNRCNVPDYNCTRIWSYYPHLSTEDLPTFDGSFRNFYHEGLALSVYEVSCRSYV